MEIIRSSQIIPKYTFFKKVNGLNIYEHLIIDKSTSLVILDISDNFETIKNKLNDKTILNTFNLDEIKNEKRIKERFGAQFLVNFLLGEPTQILHRDNGMPYLEGKENLNISIAHTIGFVAVGISEQSYIGIDIERKNGRAFEVKDKFITPWEMSKIILKRNHPYLKDYATLIWSAKESMYKLTQSSNTKLPDNYLKALICDCSEAIFLKRGIMKMFIKNIDSEQTEVKYIRYPKFYLTYCHEQ